jgi:hypothetical protein
MLYVPGENPVIRENLDRLLDQSTPETTSDGFMYFVADPDASIGLSHGMVRRTPEQSEITLVLNGNAPREIRDKIAKITIGVEEHLDDNQYALAYAARDVLKWEDDSEFFENAACIDVFSNALKADLQWIQSSTDFSPQTKERLKLEAKAALGWTALYRGVSSEGLQAYTEFKQKGLWIPNSREHDVEICGFMKTKNGTVRASFKSMPEHSERHTCACCSSQILKDTTRMSVSLDKNDGYSDHHHYHITCFYESVLPKFDFETLEEAPIKLG